MDYKVIWSPRGLSCLEELVRYIAKHNPFAARGTGEALLKQIQMLGRFPRMGHVFTKLNREDVRETIVRPYRVIYHVDDQRQCVNIITIWHGARQDPEISHDELT